MKRYFLSSCLFPFDIHCCSTSRCRRWLANLRRPELDRIPLKHLRRYYRVCAHHFEDSQFTKNILKTKTQLIPDAVPTLFDVAYPLFSLEKVKGKPKWLSSRAGMAVDKDNANANVSPGREIVNKSGRFSKSTAGGATVARIAQNSGVQTPELHSKRKVGPLDSGYLPGYALSSAEAEANVLRTEKRCREDANVEIERALKLHCRAWKKEEKGQLMKVKQELGVETNDCDEPRVSNNEMEIKEEPPFETCVYNTLGEWCTDLNLNQKPQYETYNSYELGGQCEEIQIKEEPPFEYHDTCGVEYTHAVTPYPHILENDSQYTGSYSQSGEIKQEVEED